MELFNTDIIPATEDGLWALPPDLPPFAGRRLLVISTPFSYMSPEEQTLHKMIAACKLTMEDCAIIRMEATDRLSWQLLSGAGAPRSILLLGILPAQLGINACLAMYAANSFLGSTFILSAGLAELESGKDLKRALWEQGLKPVFGAVS